MRTRQGRATADVPASASRRDDVTGPEPGILLALDRRWYLVAYDLDRHDWRNFRVDRITAARPDGHRFRPRELPAEDAADFVRRSISAAPTNYDISAVLHGPISLAQDRLGAWADLRALPRNRCVLTMHSDSLEWAAMALGFRCRRAELGPAGGTGRVASRLVGALRPGQLGLTTAHFARATRRTR
jgi:hypothetical protein